MPRERAHRGVSVGTVAMLCITCVVVIAFSLVLNRLNGSNHIHIDTDKVLQALSLEELLPELSLNEIPISTPQATTVLPSQTVRPESPQTAAPLQTVQALPTATPTPPPGGSITMTFSGSIIVDTDLRQANYYSESKKYDFTELLALVKDDISADFSMVMLENTMDGASKLSDNNTTADVLPMLTGANVGAVALGYRQAYDLGFSGLNATVSAAQQQGLMTLGAYADEASADVSQRLMTLNGIKVAVLHYTDVLSDKGAKTMKKDGNSFAVALDAVNDGADAILTDISAVRAQGAQVVIVSLNWGSTGKTAPTSKQTAFAQQLANAGVDAIIGTGSKVIQPAVWLTGNLTDGTTKQVLCAYSLGSLLNSSRTNANVAGMLLHLHISYDGQHITLDEASYTPTYIWRYKQDGRYYYRVVPSNQPAPGGMENSQQESMARALQNVQKYLGEDSPLLLR